jgi:S-adenosylmethionine hydrolase
VLVTLLSDFGLLDEYVGVTEAVIAGIAPDARVVHLTHGIAPHAVLPGALALANALPFCPVGVHVAVVDPTVGSARRAVVLRTADGRLLVGPDNGLLLPAAEVVGGVVAAFEITDHALFLEPVSRTFHGRDVFAPVAGHLACGLDPAAVGPAVDPSTLTRIAIPAPVLAPGRVEAVALAIDRFGNVALNVAGAELSAHGLPFGTRVEVRIGEGRFLALRAPTFADVRPSEMVVYDDSSGRAALAMNSGSIVDVADVATGATVRITLA